MQGMRGRLTRLLPCALATAAAALLAAPAAHADSVANVLQEYQSSGQIDACKHSAGALGGGVGNDLEQYATDFVDALRQAQLAHGRCGGGSSSSSSSGGGSTSDNGSSGGGAPGSSKGPPGPPGPKHAGSATSLPGIGGGSSAGAAALPVTLKRGSGGSTPGPIVILGILGGLLLLGGVPALIGRYFGFGFSWLAPLRHVFGEGALRVGSAGSGLVDWLRLDALRRTA
jgi:hypothetical protein